MREAVQTPTKALSNSLTINKIGVQERCEVCHQGDLLDKETNVCERCAGILVTPIAEKAIKESGKRRFPKRVVMSVKEIVGVIVIGIPLLIIALVLGDWEIPVIKWMWGKLKGEKCKKRVQVAAPTNVNR